MGAQRGDGLYEYACHEGNYALHGILAGGRQNDREGIKNDEQGRRRVGSPASSG